MDTLRAAIEDPAFAGLSDQAIADALNARRVTVRRPVSQTVVKQHSAFAGFYAEVQLAAENPSTPLETRKNAINLLGWVNDATGNMPPIDLDSPEVQSIMQKLVECGLITPPQAVGLLALADASIPWTESVGIGEVGIGSIQLARRNP
jgi:hypothetical protein